MILVQQTRDEKIAMYMKLEKRELIEMLLANQELVMGYMLRPQQPVVTQPMGCVCPSGVVCGSYNCPRRGNSWNFQGSVGGSHG